MKSKVFAHYLPQFHRVRENSEWWSPGFTEWTNVAKARALFPGHYQPHIPADLGFYDLSTVDIMHEQAHLAREHGVDGFNFYFYWFDGRRILEKPLENFLSSKVDIEFSLCWANENWTRRWDGADKEVLLEQTYEEDFELELFRDLLPYFQDPRYLRVDGKPVLSIYRAQEIPNVKKVMSRLRELAASSGLGGLHLIAVESFGLENSALVGADAMMEFPPHGVGAECITGRPPGISENFVGQVMDYPLVIRNAVRKPPVDGVYYRGLMPSWDNTARTGERAHFFLDADPKSFRLWLEFALTWSELSFDPDCQPLIFVNAWNEWAEGAHLEPDLRNGLAYLKETQSVTFGNLRPMEAIQRDINRLVHTRHRETSVSTTAKGSSLAALELARGLARELTVNNAKQVVRLLRKDKSGRQLLSAASSAFLAVLRVNSGKWRPAAYLSEETPEVEWDRKLLVTCHIHYPEYVQRFCNLLDKFPEAVSFVVTTDDVEILNSLTQKNLANLEVHLCENRGRNFGPLLVELSEKIKNYEYVLHLHSKKSLHSSRKFAKRWADLHWQLLGEDQNLFRRLMKLMESDKSLSISYPLATSIVRPGSFNWFENESEAKVWFSNNHLEFVTDPLPYPAGGMFLSRVEHFELLWSQNWKYEDFPEELGQIDGTTQHMLERLFGALPISLGHNHLVYLPSEDKFTTDSSYPRSFSGE